MEETIPCFHNLFIETCGYSDRGVIQDAVIVITFDEMHYVKFNR
jgi:hypothetical protein